MRRLFLIITLIISHTSVSQNKDALGWTGLSVELPIVKDLEATFESQARFDQNLLRFSQLYGEMALQYKVYKRLNAGVIYRYSRKNQGDYFFNDNRFSLYLRYRVKFDAGFDLDFKGKYQHNFDRIAPLNEVNPDKKNLLRWSVKLKYENEKFKRLQPFVATEIFNALRPNNSTSFLDSYRFKAGLMIDLPKRFEIKTFYMFEHENRSVDNKNHIFCVQVNYLFKKLIKSKKPDKEEEEAPSESN